jgi:hypothetical protein
VFEAKTREIVEADGAAAIEAAQLKLDAIARFVEVVPDEAVGDNPGEAVAAAENDPAEAAKEGGIY